MADTVHTETDTQGIEYRILIEADDVPVRGNALASGDDRADKEAEDSIIERLESGDTWAWACVTVEARYKGFTGRDVLGTCSYADTEAFIRDGGYYPDMKDTARANLLQQLEAACEALAGLKAVTK
jgi:hypothetical protein